MAALREPRPANPRQLRVQLGCNHLRQQRPSEKRSADHLRPVGREISRKRADQRPQRARPANSRSSSNQIAAVAGFQPEMALTAGQLLEPRIVARASSHDLSQPDPQHEVQAYVRPSVGLDMHELLRLLTLAVGAWRTSIYRTDTEALTSGTR